MSLRKAESEKQSREQNVRSLQGEMASQDEAVARISKEKKQQEEVFLFPYWKIKRISELRCWKKNNG